MVNYCYLRDKLQYNNQEYPLDELRQYLLRNYEPLCLSYFIKRIWSEGRWLLTYDWYHLLKAAHAFGYDMDYIKTKGQ